MIRDCWVSHGYMWNKVIVVSSSDHEVKGVAILMSLLFNVLFKIKRIK